jgi:hypothetical protein
LVGIGAGRGLTADGDELETADGVVDGAVVNKEQAFNGEQVQEEEQEQEQEQEQVRFFTLYSLITESVSGTREGEGERGGKGVHIR